MRRIGRFALLLLAALLGGAAVWLLKPNETTGSNASAATPVSAKQLWTCGMHPQVIQDHPGICPICHMKLVPLKTENDEPTTRSAKDRKVAYYWDPMLGPSSISDHPGKSAMGMDLVPVFEDQASAGPAVRIDPTVVQNMGVRTAPVVRGSLNRAIRAVGLLDVPQPAMHDVTLKIAGYVEKLYADTNGMVVHKGDILFDLYSPDLQLAEQELISAVQQSKSADGAGKEAAEMVDSAKRKLQFWDIADQDIETIAAADKAPRTVPFRSPADGHIMDSMIVQGSAVQAGMKIMSIEDHSALWLNVQIYEDQLPFVSVGEKVEAVVDGAPGQTFEGKITFIFPHLDHMARTETVRATLVNLNHLLRPGMYATAHIFTQPIANAILAPREAVIDTGTRQIAFVMDPTSPGHFQPRYVKMGLAGDDDQVEILEGLAPGEQVVTSGQFLMDVESRTTEAIDKLRGTLAQ